MSKKRENITHTKADVAELKKWFNEHADRLPKEMQIAPGLYSPDLFVTIKYLFEQADECYENPRMQGCFFLLDKIKKKLETENLS